MKENTYYYGRLVTKDWSLYLVATKDGLCFIGSENRGLEEVKAWLKKTRRPIDHLVEDFEKVKKYADELEQYMDGERKNFQLPIVLQGTPFQEAVWATLQQIPFGETKSYSDVADSIGKPKAVRAVGTAIGANPLPIVVPCHRVIGKSGKLTGYRGGIAMKKKLLDLEGVSI
ncbi:methylated-DNA--[protein]-cysteine S-methyltransferase [Pseudogracilibacillus auburnensis]|uniref:Methylated-DNA--protein-cysteine methyltransferase n=1 Tax=Pseudogracilibacillus auburnensis TaxID=1494959 RepID=A0A2V3VTL0_9BACI|nr:methylated-DNA--[protein]-cysteine S-methyltransferase [Pseudogracilibacillus auburnensis]MBO1004554.1 methylated-DNA--[protein]-cysteine S-methyltransferase [Pseudogracilibacillus auburnensis]PXW85243.1 methylated-DNA-[protein]-cysteine S-methyltransferase [Pseudogracilibacillus auburnensis]